MASRSCLATVILAVIASIFIGWGLMRASKYGLNNIFSREHTFLDGRPLTDEVAIELTKKALEADGYDTSALVPTSGFSRNSINLNSGYVSWEPLPEEPPWPYYLVRVDKEGEKVRCRVYLGK